jgi:hypothetical protein
VACTWLAPGLYHACASHVLGLRLACTWPAPILGRLCPAFHPSSFILHLGVALVGFALRFCIHPSALCIRPSVALGGFDRSLSILDCSLAEKIALAGDKPRNTPNTRKANRQEVSLPRISRIPRSIPSAFSCGFTALCLCVGCTAYSPWFRLQLSGLHPPQCCYGGRGIPQPFTISLPNTTRPPRLSRAGLVVPCTYPGQVLYP